MCDVSITDALPLQNKINFVVQKLLVFSTYLYQFDLLILSFACRCGLQVALNWNLQKGFLVLVGIRSVEQVGVLSGSSTSNNHHPTPQLQLSNDVFLLQNVL